MWCDKIVVLLHACTDKSAAIVQQVVAEYPSRLLVLYETMPLWEEMRHRQRMLEAARGFGTHIAMIDADEILTANLIGRIRVYADELPEGTMLQLPWICLSDTFSFYSSGMWAYQQASVLFKDAPECHWQARNGYDFHHRQPMGKQWLIPASYGGRNLSLRTEGLMHLQFLGKRRLFAKQFLYQLTERLRWPDREPIAQMAAKYSRTVDEALNAQQSSTPAAWWAGYGNLVFEHLHVDAEPWQEQECKRIIADNPGIEQGLNDFGMMMSL
jgi:hypothetical protein